MKKISLLFIIALFSVSGFSQGEIQNATKFTINWLRPIRNFGEDVNTDAAQNKYKFFTEKMEADHYGGGIDFGTTFYIHPTEIIDGFKAGFLVDFFDLSANYFRYSDTTTIINSGLQQFEENVTSQDLTGRFSMNIGLLATISPAKKLYFDLYGKLRPTFSVHYHNTVQDFNGTVYYDYYESSSSLIWRQQNEDTGLGFGLLYSFGLDIRYSRFVLGSEFVMGSVKYSYDNPANDKTMYDQYFKVKLGFFFSER
ncbi:MAG: hypothetical protein ACOCWB_01860 [Bacteroidota bacterium]